MSVEVSDSNSTNSFLNKTFDVPAALSPDKIIDADINVIIVDISTNNSISTGKMFFDMVNKVNPKSVRLVKISLPDVDDSLSTSNYFERNFKGVPVVVHELDDYKDEKIIPLMKEWLEKTNEKNTSKVDDYSEDLNSMQKCYIF